jgi:hypothetical protein
MWTTTQQETRTSGPGRKEGTGFSKGSNVKYQKYATPDAGHDSASFVPSVALFGCDSSSSARRIETYLLRQARRHQRWICGATLTVDDK